MCSTKNSEVVSCGGGLGSNETVGPVILSDIFGAVLEVLLNQIIEKFKSVDKVSYLTNISN